MQQQPHKFSRFVIDGFTAVEVGSPADYDQLIVTGDVNLIGAPILGIRYVYQYEPEPGTRLVFVAVIQS
jgi:hypothetical protein